ncbi:MAG: hypothetical protein EBU84_04535 [Actinobacteria bacterium]|nr:hypothetical protein [Actinomycetota bacterium]
MNAFEYGFFHELQKLATQADGTLSTRGEVPAFKMADRFDPKYPTFDSKYPGGTTPQRRRAMQKENAFIAANNAASSRGADIGLGLGTLAGGALTAKAMANNPNMQDSIGPLTEFKALADQMHDSYSKGMATLGGTALGGGAGALGGSYIGSKLHELGYKAKNAARVARARAYIGQRAAREVSGVGNKARAFLGAIRSK